MGIEPGKTRALIVEDDAVFRELLATLIREQLCCTEVLEAGGVTEGRGATLAGNPDVVFLDVRLPDGSGLALARELKARHPGLKVVVCSNYDLPEYRDAAEEAGASRFVPKDKILSDACWKELSQVVSGTA